MYKNVLRSIFLMGISIAIISLVLEEEYIKLNFAAPLSLQLLFLQVKVDLFSVSLQKFVTKYQ